MSHRLLFLVDIHVMIVLLQILSGVMEKISSQTQVSCTNEIRIGQMFYPCFLPDKPYRSFTINELIDDKLPTFGSKFAY